MEMTFKCEICNSDLCYSVVRSSNYDVTVSIEPCTCRVDRIASLQETIENLEHTVELQLLTIGELKEEVDSHYRVCV